MTTSKAVHHQKFYKDDCSTFRYMMGFFLASFFSVTYILTPIYSLACIYFLCTSPTSAFTLKFASLFFLSIVLPCVSRPKLLSKLTPMLDFFQYEEIHELSYTELAEMASKNPKKKYLLVAQPHGVLSYCGFCAKVACPPKFGHVPTAAAASLMKTPILKQVIGCFTLVDASKQNLKKVFKREGIEGNVILYVGGIAELFKCSRREERLYLSKRKGFIKLALQEGVDIIPVYFFGNTGVLSVLSSGPLASLSRKLGACVTYFWGFAGLPLPRFGEKCVYARGRPLGLPEIKEPSQDDIDKWHKLYCNEVRRLYEKYQEKVPHYKDKPLFID